MQDSGRSMVIKPLALLIIHSQMNPSESNHLEGERSMPDRAIFGKMTTDDQGWPLLAFVPNEESLNTVAAFLQDDVDVVVPCCDELLQAIRSVLDGREEEWIWNGNRFLVLVRKDHVRITDKYGEAISNIAPVTIDTALLALIVGVWKDFVSALPRHQEFANSSNA